MLATVLFSLLTYVLAFEVKLSYYTEKHEARGHSYFSFFFFVPATEMSISPLVTLKLWMFFPLLLFGKQLRWIILSWKNIVIASGKRTQS